MPGLFAPTTDRLLLLDGAMGSELLRRGASVEPVEVLTTEAETVAAIHSDYARAGAKVHVTATFQLNPVTLEAASAGPHLTRLVERALFIARRSAGPGAIVLGDIGPLIDPSTGEEILDFDVLHETAAAYGMADGILLETVSTLGALRAVEYLNHRVSEAAELPIVLSIAYHKRGRAYLSASGHGPEVFARHATKHGVAVLGVNCGRDIGPEDLIEILRRYRAETDLPLWVKANAGTPNARGRYPLTADEFGEYGPLWREAGATLIGGCCGTTPAHIAALRTSLGMA